MDISASLPANQTEGFKSYKKSGSFKTFNTLRNYVAKQYAKLYPKDLFIGVTGASDNALCVEASAAVISQKFNTIKTDAGVKPSLAIPKILFRITPGIKKIVLNMEIDAENEMDVYLSLVMPKVVVITKINPPNSEPLGKVDTALKEINKLISRLPEDGALILNWEDPNSKKLAENYKGDVIYYGTDPQNCTVWAGNVKIEDFRTTFELNRGVERVKVNLQLLGMNQVYPMLAAAALGFLHNIPLTKIKLALEGVAAPDHNLQAMFGPGGSIILDDTSSCSPTNLQSAIDTILKIPARRKILVLGEMKGLGSLSDTFHRQAAQMIYKEKFDQIYLGSGDANIIADELKNLGFWEERLQANLQNSQLVGMLLKNLGKGDLCLIKGSQAVRLDEVVKRISKRT
jgi:UDP-N-acetylmuramoyl-tripeptide--D-alanyl-D-alanine ligase